MNLFDHLRLQSTFTPSELSAIIATAPKRYKKYAIAKRAGGERWIAQPSRELKTLQYILLDDFLTKLRVHDAAYAYVPDKGIRANANFHRNSDFLLKLDFHNFFNSIKPRDFNKALKSSGILLPLDERRMLHKILFWGDGSYAPSRLSVGAPTSPLISNAIMYDIDEFASELASHFDLKYTRYADDICASGNSREALLQFERSLSSHLLRTKTPDLRLNHNKRGLYGRGERRMITGLIITPASDVSIGRERKRLISSMVYRFISDGLDTESFHKLHGLISFAWDVERSFVKSIDKRHGISIRKLLGARAKVLQDEQRALD